MSTTDTYGAEYEKKAIEYIKEQFGDIIVNIGQIEYTKAPLIEHYGIDIMVRLIDGTSRNIQVKSRTKDKTDFAFEVDKLQGKYFPKNSNADWFIYYLPNWREEPVVFSKEALLLMWKKYYDEFTSNVRANNQGDGYCTYVSPSLLINVMKELFRGKAGAGSVLMSLDALGVSQKLEQKHS